MFDDITRWIARDSVGRVWVPSNSISDVIQVYDPDGTYQEFTRSGQGPGEFKGLHMMTCHGGDFVMLDGDRFSTIDPVRESLSFLFRTSEVGSHRATGALFVDDSLLWLSSPSRHPDFLGYPLTVVDIAAGRVVGAYGKFSSHYDRVIEHHTTRFLARLDENRIVAVAENSYEISTYALDGQRLRHYVRDAPWVRPTDGFSTPSALVVGVQALSRHEVAVYLAVWDERFDPMIEEGSSDDPTLDETWNGVVEVLDLRQGAVLARLEIPFFPVGPVCPSGELAVLTQDPRRGIDFLRLNNLRWQGR